MQGGEPTLGPLSSGFEPDVVRLLGFFRCPAAAGTLLPDPP